MVEADGGGMKSGWMESNGARYFRADLTGFGDDLRALEGEIAEALAVLRRERQLSVLLLVEFRDTAVSMRTVGVVKTVIGDGADSIKRAAVAIRLSGMIGAFLDSMIRLSGGMVRRFDDASAAEAWLTGGETGPE
jgi:hypothetical protein